MAKDTERFKMFGQEYGDTRNGASDISCPEKGRTKQSFKDECDIDKIMDRAIKTGVFPGQNEPPRYGDATNAMSFMDIQNAIATGREMFSRLSNVDKAKFDNDVEKFLTYGSDEKNAGAVLEMFGYKNPEEDNKNGERKDDNRPQVDGKNSNAPSSPTGGEGRDTGSGATLKA